LEFCGRDHVTYHTSVPDDSNKICYSAYRGGFVSLNNLKMIRVAYMETSKVWIARPILVSILSRLKRVFTMKT
jgi:hypothetical protein